MESHQTAHGGVLKRRIVSTLAVTVAIAALPVWPLSAADHADGPAVTADPVADIGDVYAWMSPDAGRLNLVMTVGRDATTATRFSDSVQYVFQMTSKADFFDPVGFDVEIICEFTAAQRISCYLGDEEFVTGNASNPGGITNSSGRMRVFAGLRDDPFFFNSQGFRAVASAVAAAAPSLSFDPAGCPDLDAATSAFLVEQLKTTTGGGAPRDDFGMRNILAIVIQVDKSLVTRGGPIVGVWGATYRR